ncbi:amidohydrolase [Microlunatus endophyticus]|uniref:Peptidase M20 domain-containing protein 2 n=1 Tax=Microlunatus endophyticus TaxID=1716077 RepID=A0A917W4C1_9ACTN|nr:amidohydrolase [Microlunatus endophyticus]GGL62107.1 amidohydrolase [Microlunatus endophyticus]
MTRFAAPEIKITDLHQAISASMTKISLELVELSMALHADPELSMDEHRAAARISQLLEDHGFSIERGIAGLPTAFQGSVGEDKPVISFLCEYDALPGVGHGCGHNLIAAGGVGAAIALKEALGDDLAGTIRCIGTPGEEGKGGKIIELREGVFDDVDAALMFHPGVSTQPWRHATACVDIDIVFHGIAAHAAGSPSQGRSALAAVIQLFNGIDSLRQFIPETSRIHGIITDGGQAANIVPERAAANFMVRALRSTEVSELLDRVKAIIEAAALATGTTYEITAGEVYAERKNNHVIASRWAAHLQRLGEWVEEPVLRGGTGSSDIGNISLVLPAIHPYLQIAEPGTPGHSHAMAAAAGEAPAQERMLHMAEALAAAGGDLLTEPELLEAARAEFATSEPDFPA